MPESEQPTARTQNHSTTARDLTIGILVALCAGCAGGSGMESAVTSPPAPSTPAYPASAVKARPKTGILPNEALMVNGIEREYRLVVPASVDLSKPVPLIFAFHGLGDSKDLMPIYTLLDVAAAQRGFILVYPNGRLRAWPLLEALAKDDLAFFDALYAKLTTEYAVDKDRVFLTGMSNGAYFCHLLGALRGEKIAAIATHSGGLGTVDFKNLTPVSKYGVLIVHGAQDGLVKVDEGRRTRDAYQKAGHPVEYLEVERWGHLWAHVAGVNERMWRFFSTHPRRAETPTLNTGK